jgi:hypothetical protein
MATEDTEDTEKRNSKRFRVNNAQAARLKRYTLNVKLRLNGL